METKVVKHTRVDSELFQARRWHAERAVRFEKLQLWTLQRQIRRFVAPLESKFSRRFFHRLRRRARLSGRLAGRRGGSCDGRLVGQSVLAQYSLFGFVQALFGSRVIFLEPLFKNVFIPRALDYIPEQDAYGGGAFRQRTPPP